MNNKTGTQEQTTKRTSNNFFDGITLIDPELTEALKDIHKKKAFYKTRKPELTEALSDLKTMFPEEVQAINQFETKLTGKKKSKAKPVEEIPDMDDCNGCLGSNREATLNDLRNCGSPANIDKFFGAIQFTTDMQVMIICKSLLKGMGFEMEGGTRDKCLNELYVKLSVGQGTKGKVKGFIKKMVPKFAS